MEEDRDREVRLTVTNGRKYEQEDRDDKMMD